MDKKEQTKLRVQRYRERQKSVTSDSVTGNSVTYPAIIHALVNPDKRKKLEKIYHSLNEFKVADKVFYGISGIPFDVVGDLLEATK